MNLLRTLQQVDRRVLYAMLVFVIVLPFFMHVRLPVPIAPETKHLYDAIDNLPPGSFVLFGVTWSAGTRGENGAQTEALMRHLMKKKLRFALLAFEPQSKTLCQRIAVRVQDQYHAREGVDWVNWGYKVNPVNFLKALAQDVPGTATADIHGTPLGRLPVMKGIHSAKDISLALDVDPTSTFTVYMQYFTNPSHIPFGLAPTAVMAPEAFTYLDSGQLVGMINGLQGAIEYEQKLGVMGKATRASVSSSFAHLLIILFIVVGNVAMIMEKRQARREEAER